MDEDNANSAICLASLRKLIAELESKKDDSIENMEKMRRFKMLEKSLLKQNSNISPKETCQVMEDVLNVIKNQLETMKKKPIAPIAKVVQNQEVDIQFEDDIEFEDMEILEFSEGESESGKKTPPIHIDDEPVIEIQNEKIENIQDSGLEEFEKSKLNDQPSKFSTLNKKRKTIGQDSSSRPPTKKLRISKSTSLINYKSKPKSHLSFENPESANNKLSSDSVKNGDEINEVEVKLIEDQNSPILIDSNDEDDESGIRMQPQPQRQYPQQQQKQNNNVTTKVKSFKKLEDKSKKRPQPISPDAEDCDWLYNFLKQFSSPLNVAHTASFSLLQRTLRKQDYRLIQEKRLNMEATEGVLDHGLFRALISIFYSNFSEKKLTFMGRKFCQLAFLDNQEERQVLTTNLHTNTVTSETRVSSKVTLHQSSAESISKINENNETLILISNAPSSTIESVTDYQLSSGDTTETTEIAPHLIDHPSAGSMETFEYGPVQSPVVADQVNETSTIDCLTDHSSRDSMEIIEDVISQNISSDFPSNKMNKKTSHSSSVQGQSSSGKTFEMAYMEIMRDVDITRGIQIEKKSSIKQSQIEKTSLKVPEIRVVTAPTKLRKLAPKFILEKLSKKKERIFNIEPSWNANAIGYCILCERTQRNLVGHYVNDHPDYEVYVSRPLPKYIKLLLNNQLESASIHYNRKKNETIVATCVFCDEEKSFSFSYWHEHFSSHTGEFAYKCQACGFQRAKRNQLYTHFQTCLHGEITVIRNHNKFTDKIMAYMCTECSYTQMSRDNLVKHLSTEHRVEKIEDRFFCNVTLLDLSKKRLNLKLPTEPVKANTKSDTENNDSDNETNFMPIIIRDQSGDILKINDGKCYVRDSSTILEETNT